MLFRWCQAFSHSVTLELWKGISNSWETLLPLQYPLPYILPFRSFRHSHTHAFTWAARHLCIRKGYWESLLFYHQDSTSSLLWDFKGSWAPLRVMHRITWKARLNGIKVNWKDSLKIHWVFIILSLPNFSLKNKIHLLLIRGEELAVHNWVTPKSLPRQVFSF